MPLTVTPVQPHSILQIEIAYNSGIADQDAFRGLMLLPVDAVKPDRPINIGDIARLELHIGSATKEGIQIRTQDVGAIFNRGGWIDSVDVQGDVGALVGVDPATRQQVADLRASVAVLAERLAQIEGGAQDQPRPLARSSAHCARNSAPIAASTKPCKHPWPLSTGLPWPISGRPAALRRQARRSRSGTASHPG